MAELDPEIQNAWILKSTYRKHFSWSLVNGVDRNRSSEHNYTYEENAKIYEFPALHSISFYS
jgi:hypothetical protein